MINVIFITHYNTMNGANQSLLALIKNIKARVGIKAVYIYGSEAKQEGLYHELTSIGVPAEFVDLKYFLYYATKYLGILSIPLKVLYNLKTWRTLVRRLKYADVDVIYSNSSLENTGIVLSWLLKTKHIWHIREFGYQDYKYRHIGSDYIKRKVLNKSDHLIAISKSISDYINLPEKTSLIYNGIFSTRELHQINKPKRTGKKMVLGLVGVINPIKNQEEAVLTLKKLMPAHQGVSLSLFGNISDRAYHDRLTDLIDQYGLNMHVNFKGFRNNKHDIYGEIDILLMCSRSEAFGRVTVEAMAYGIPVVGYNHAGTAELIRHNENGFLYNDHAGELVNYVKQLIEDEKLYQHLSVNAMASAHRFTVERYTEQVLGLINSSPAKG